MVGMHFVLILPDPNGGPTNIRSGHVTQKLGNSHWLFQFKGKNYPFSNAFNEEQLEKFAFFKSEKDAEQFIAELVEAQGLVPAEQKAPVVVEAEVVN
jgi:hypothetical protein